MTDVAPAGQREADAEGPAVRIAHLSKRYGARNAIADVSLEVARGEVFALLGPRGAGKSTLLKVLGTVLRPTAGMVRVAGLDPITHPRAVRRRVSLVTSGASFDTRLTAREALLLHVPHEEVLLAGADRRVDLVLARSGLSEAADELIRDLPAAHLRRLSIARGLLNAPQVLLLDEPTIGLDAASRAAIWHDVLDARADAGFTIVVATREMAEAKTADRVAVLSQGHVIAIAAPADLAAAAVAGFSAGPLHGHGLPHPHLPSLSDVFGHLPGSPGRPQPGEAG